MVRASPGRSGRSLAPESLNALGRLIIETALQEKKVEVAARVLEHLTRLEGSGSEAAAKPPASGDAQVAREVVVYSAVPISEAEWRQKYGPSE